MPKLEFTPQELSRFFNGQLKHKGYNETVLMATDMAIHADGIYPEKLIEERRPSESLEVKEYRKKIWKAITKPIFGKVIVELNKIRRSSEWSIKYDASKLSSRIDSKETLQEYCEKKYPYFTSVTNWLFKVLLPSYCKDANAVIAICPINPQAAANEYVQPFSYFFGSNCVIYFKQDDYAVIKSTDKVVYTSASGSQSFGDVFLIFTTKYIQRWEQGDGTLKFGMAWQYDHNLDTLPVFRVEGLYKKTLDDTFIFESRLAAMLPRLDEALREYSDLQAEIVSHMFSERWEVATDECSGCQGKGYTQVAGFTSEKVTCRKCEGAGVKKRSPYQTLYIKQGMAGENNSGPTLPAGYIQKNVEIVKIQDERIDKHIWNALSAINMEYLAETPLNQSGTAKEVDKDALNNFVHSIGEDIIATMDRIYRVVNNMRYLFVLSSNERNAMLPYINVPEKFDLLSSTYLEDQIAKQKQGNGNPLIIAAMEEDYVNKKFVGDDRLRQKVLLSISLDPLIGVNEDEKMTRLSNKGITLETYILSCNIQEFISMAIDEKGESFYSMGQKEQKLLLRSYAKNQIQNDSAGGSIIADLNSAPTGGLKDSVGGLTGMIEIAKAVASGLYDLDAAVALVSDRFNISVEEARKQLGTPNISDSQQKIEKVAALT